MPHVCFKFAPAVVCLPLLVLVAMSRPQGSPADLPADAASAAHRLSASPRHGEWVDVALPGSDTKIKTWIAYPERRDKAPVVLVIHEIFGLTDWIRAVADQLAADGFIAVAPDLLSGKGPGGGGTESFEGDSVRDAIRKLGDDEVARRLDVVREHAIKLAAATDKSATIGFCWGGSASFAYATAQPKLNAAVVYYGTAPIEHDRLKKITCPVLGLYGEDDARVNATLDGTTTAMKDLGKSFEKHMFAGAGHGFLRQSGVDERNGANHKAAKEAWARTIEFLKSRLN